MTIQQDKAALRAEYERKERELEITHAMREKVSQWIEDTKDGPEWRFHAHSSKLYGVVGTIKVSGGYNRRHPTLMLAERLAEAFPSVPLVMLRDSCLSFQPLPYVESKGADYLEKYQEETPVCGWLLEVNQNHFDAGFVLNWYSEIEGIGLVEIEVHFPLHDKAAIFGRASHKRKEHRGGFTIEQVKFEPNYSAIGLVRRDDESLAELQPTIKWASGSHETAGRITAYWVNYRPEADKAATALDFIRQAQSVL